MNISKLRNIFEQSIRWQMMTVCLCIQNDIKSVLHANYKQIKTFNVTKNLFILAAVHQIICYSNGILYKVLLGKEDKKKRETQKQTHTQCPWLLWQSGWCPWYWQ